MAYIRRGFEGAVSFVATSNFIVSCRAISGFELLKQQRSTYHYRTD